MNKGKRAHELSRRMMPWLFPFCAATAFAAPGPFAVEDVKGGSVAKHEHFESIDVHHWTLSNGAEVVFKSTDVASTPVLINTVFPGGLSLIPNVTESRATLAGTAVTASGMRGIRDSALINLFNLHRTAARGFRLEKEAVITMRSVPEEIDFAFRALYILLEGKPKVDIDVLEITRQKVTTNITASVQQPQFQYLHQTNEAIWPGRIFGNLNLSVDELTIVDADWVNAMSERLWRNVNGAWFLISGPIDAETVENYVTQYLGGLEGGNRRQEVAATDTYAKSSKEVRVKLNPQDRSNVQMFFLEPNADTEDLKAVMTRLTFAALLNARLQDTARVKEGLVYSISARPAEPNYPMRHGGMRVQFTSDPGNVDEIEAIVRSEIAAMSEGVIEADLASVRKMQVRGIEQAWEQPAIVVAQTAGRLRQGLPVVSLTDITKAIESVTTKNVSARATQVAQLTSVVSEFAPKPEAKNPGISN